MNDHLPPPHDLDAERALVGSVLLGGVDLDELRAVVEPSDCYDPKHGEILAAAIAEHESHGPVNAVTVLSRLRALAKSQSIGGAAYLAQLADDVPSSAAWAGYGRIVRGYSDLRRVQKLAGEVFVLAGRETAAGADAFVDLVESRFGELRRATRAREPRHVSEIVQDTIANLEAISRMAGLTGLATGLRDVDKILGGLQRSDLVVVAGRPSMGKSSLALGWSLHAAWRLGVPTLFFSLEMPGRQLVQRIWAAEGVPLQAIRTATYSQSQFAVLLDTSSEVSKAPLWIDDSGAPSLLEIRAKCRRRARDGLGLVVVDYLQLMRTTGTNRANREQEVAAQSGGLKALAKELDVPVVALAQLNRDVEKRENKRPVKSDLRESGAIENDADVVALLYRDEVYNAKTPDRGVAEVIVDKQRNGPTGTVRVAFDAECARFRDLAPEQYAQEGA